MKVEIYLDVDELNKLENDLNEGLEENKDNESYGSAEILEILEKNGIEIT